MHFYPVSIRSSFIRSFFSREDEAELNADTVVRLFNIGEIITSFISELYAATGHSHCSIDVSEERANRVIVHASLFSLHIYCSNSSILSFAFIWHVSALGQWAVRVGYRYQHTSSRHYSRLLYMSALPNRYQRLRRLLIADCLMNEREIE